MVFALERTNEKKKISTLFFFFDLNNIKKKTASPAQAAGRPLPARGVPTPRPELGRQLRQHKQQQV